MEVFTISVIGVENSFGFQGVPQLVLPGVSFTPCINKIEKNMFRVRNIWDGISLHAPDVT